MRSTVQPKKQRTSRFRQGNFVPRNVEKYKGNIQNITYRSSWELRFMQFLDGNPNILEWNSEEVAIPYVKPTDSKVHRYFPDFWIKYKNKNGEVIQEIIEIKPAKQTASPTKVGKRKNQQLIESITYAINIAKWQAATQFCNKYGMKFRLLTENELFK